MEGEPKLPPSWAASIGLGAADAAKNELKAVRQQLEEALAQNKVLRAKADNSRGVDDATRERDAWRRRAERAEKKVEALTKRRPLPKNAAHARLLRRLKRNIAREMRDAEQGFVINKVTEKHGKTEVRRVAVCPHMLVLKWCHAHEAFGSTSKWLDLRTVKKVEYGPKARASKLFPEVSPWLCFSLVTADRQKPGSLRSETWNSSPAGLEYLSTLRGLRCLHGGSAAARLSAAACGDRRRCF